MTGMTYDIVAGYDGSPGSAQAVRWAAREALARGTALTVCLAWRPGHMELASQPATWELAGQDGKKILACGLPYAELVLGPGRVHAELVGGSAAQVLCERSRTAEMVVVGSRGHGKLPGLRLGSVSWQVAGHASGRVVIVGGRWRPVNQAPGPVVVGVDGSAASQAALTFAFEEAALRDVPLEALCALADAPGRLGEMRLIEDDFNQRDGLRAKGAPGYRGGAQGYSRHAAVSAADRRGPVPDAHCGLPRPRRLRGHEPGLGRPGSAALFALPGGDRSPAGMPARTGLGRCCGRLAHDQR